jgi:hypothetical protein
MRRAQTCDGSGAIMITVEDVDLAGGPDDDTLAERRAVAAVEQQHAPHSSRCGASLDCYIPDIPQLEKNLTTIVARVHELPSASRFQGPPTTATTRRIISYDGDHPNAAATGRSPQPPSTSSNPPRILEGPSRTLQSAESEREARQEPGMVSASSSIGGSPDLAAQDGRPAQAVGPRRRRTRPCRRALASKQSAATQRLLGKKRSSHQERSPFHHPFAHAGRLSLQAAAQRGHRRALQPRIAGVDRSFLKRWTIAALPPT